VQSVQTLNAESEVERRGVALLNNISAGKGLMNVLKSNLGPKGTLKM
jgi:T-complex protein 1 subunit zeta